MHPSNTSGAQSPVVKYAHSPYSNLAIHTDPSEDTYGNHNNNNNNQNTMLERRMSQSISSPLKLEEDYHQNSFSSHLNTQQQPHTPNIQIRRSHSNTYGSPTLKVGSGGGNTANTLRSGSLHGTFSSSPTSGSVPQYSSSSLYNNNNNNNSYSNYPTSNMGSNFYNKNNNEMPIPSSSAPVRIGMLGSNPNNNSNNNTTYNTGGSNYNSYSKGTSNNPYISASNPNNSLSRSQCYSPPPNFSSGQSAPDRTSFLRSSAKGNASNPNYTSNNNNSYNNNYDAPHNSNPGSYGGPMGGGTPHRGNCGNAGNGSFSQTPSQAQGRSGGSYAPSSFNAAPLLYTGSSPSGRNCPPLSGFALTSSPGSPLPYGASGSFASHNNNNNHTNAGTPHGSPKAGHSSSSVNRSYNNNNNNNNNNANTNMGANVERETYSASEVSGSSGSSIREDLSLCQEDDGCVLINDRKHQRKFAHTCRLFPCYHGNVARHAKLFRHAPGQIANADAIGLHGVKVSSQALTSVNFSSISAEAPNAYRIYVTKGQKSCEIFGDWANVKVHTFKRYLNLVFHIAPTAQQLRVLKTDKIMDDELSTVKSYNIVADNIIELKDLEGDDTVGQGLTIDDL